MVCSGQSGHASTHNYHFVLIARVCCIFGHFSLWSVAGPDGLSLRCRKCSYENTQLFFTHATATINLLFRQIQPSASDRETEWAMERASERGGPALIEANSFLLGTISCQLTTWKKTNKKRRSSKPSNAKRKFLCIFFLLLLLLPASIPVVN